MEKDKNELNNIYHNSDYAQVLAELQELLHQHQKKLEDPVIQKIENLI